MLGREERGKEGKGKARGAFRERKVKIVWGEGCRSLLVSHLYVIDIVGILERKVFSISFVFFTRNY